MSDKKHQTNKIFVTQPSLANLDSYIDPYLMDIWESGIVTHHGPKVQKLEKELTSYLGVNYLSTIVNCTIALQLAIKALDLHGEIITTPFSYVATVGAINWERCTPIFADIDPETFNLDPTKVESKITKKTTAIMPVHVFSNPCDTKAFSRLAKKYNLKIIYDAAHAFGVNHYGKSIYSYGDISCASFHATKLFNTGEGGACITNKKSLHQKINSLRYFGHNQNRKIVSIGTNAKMTEIHASLGLTNLDDVSLILKDRKEKYQRYIKNLQSNSYIRFQKFSPKEYNYSYMPIVFSSETKLLKVIYSLEKNNIIPRRYFYPSLNTMKPYKQTGLPISEELSRKILCLPLYYSLRTNDIDRICDIINRNLS